MWIYEHQHWPNFTWDSGTLSDELAGVRYRQGLLLGRMEALGFELKQEATLQALTQDIVTSWAIEGEDLNPTEVRSSIARRLGVEMGGIAPSSRHVDGLVEMMLDATQNAMQPLTKERLLGWHGALFPTGRSGLYTVQVGSWRSPDSDPMQVVSGPMGRQKVHFEAPRAALLDQEMQAFLRWVETPSPVDPILMAGIVHVWFLTLHPFEDGNGRIARALADLFLARADGSPHRFYSLSFQIEQERAAYYRQLERQQLSPPDLTLWLHWFLGCLDRAIAHADHLLQAVLCKAKVWEELNLIQANPRQCLVITRMLEPDFKGHLNTSKYAKLAKCSNDTALRDIQGLVQRNILIQNPGGGRSTSYRLG